MKMTLKPIRFQPLLSKKIDFAIFQRPQEVGKIFVTKFFNSNSSLIIGYLAPELAVNLLKHLLFFSFPYVP